MDTAAALFLVSLFAPPAIVLTGVVVAVWRRLCKFTATAAPPAAGLKACTTTDFSAKFYLYVLRVLSGEAVPSRLRTSFGND